MYLIIATTPFRERHNRRCKHRFWNLTFNIGLLRQNLLYTVYSQNSRYFDEKAIFTRFMRGFFNFKITSLDMQKTYF